LRPRFAGSLYDLFLVGLCHRHFHLRGVATAVAFSIQLWAQQYTTPGHAAILFTLEPVFAVLTSYLFLGERLALRAILALRLCLREF